MKFKFPKKILKKISHRLWFSSIVTLFIFATSVGAYFLVQNSQDIRKSASDPYDNDCSNSNCMYYDCSQRIDCATGKIVYGFCETGYPSSDPCMRNGDSGDCTSAGYICTLGSQCCSGSCIGGKCQQSQSPTQIPTPTTSSDPYEENCTCIYNSSCYVVNKQPCQGVCNPACNYPAICCGDYLENKCDKGNSYCVDKDTVAICKADWSGYVIRDCEDKKVCDEAEGVCRSPIYTDPTPSTAKCEDKGGDCIYNSSCGVVNRYSLEGSCNYPAICCGDYFENKCTKGNSYCVDNDTVAICKADWSGYVIRDCDSGTCDSNQGACTKPCEGTCYQNSSCSAIGRDPASGTCRLSTSVCCQSEPKTVTCEGTCYTNSSCSAIGKVDASGTCLYDTSVCCKEDTNCIPENGTWSSTTPCCDGLVKTASQYGYYCRKPGTCTPGTTKCQNDGLDYFEYRCDSSGYYTKNKRCDFGCDGNSCKLEGCTPGEKQCSSDKTAIEVCTSDGSGWSKQYCGSGNSCDSQTLTCEVTPWHFTCSLAGDYAMYVNNYDLGIDWSKSIRCEDGCENGECKGGEKTTCSEGELSFDNFEKCVNGEWQCIPGQSRILSAPGQSNISDLVFMCDDNHNQYPTRIDNDSLESLSCDKDKLIDGEKNVVTICSDEEECLEAGVYNFIESTGCYNNNFILANTCKNGEIKSPTKPYECELVCNDNSWEFSEPLVCIRDPNVIEEITCDNEGRVIQKDKVLEVCTNGCSHGKCLPLEEALCNSNDGYLSGDPPCLVICIDAKYQTTDICSNALKMEQDDWNNQDLFLLLQTINRFPDSLKDIIFDVEFIRLEELYVGCDEDGCYAGYYQNSTETIALPDSGINQATINHEIIHAVDYSDPNILEEYIEASGCSQNPADPNGSYVFSETPYRDYGTTNCQEGLAVSCGEEYMDSQMSCNMSSSRPNTYDFCKNYIFDGVEYCQEDFAASCGECTNSQMSYSTKSSQPNTYNYCKNYIFDGVK
jgi:hypothetical protein